MVVVFYSRTDIPGPANAQHTLVVDIDAMVMAKVVIESPVSLVWALLVDLLDLVSQTLIFLSSAAQFP